MIFLRPSAPISRRVAMAAPFRPAGRAPGRVVFQADQRGVATVRAEHDALPDRGVLQRVAAKAQPTVERFLDGWGYVRARSLLQRIFTQLG